MAAYLICLTSGSGIPVFTRTVGNVKPLPFPVIGSLNAVHMFAANHDAVLKSTTTEDAQIVWKEYENSLVLILVRGRDASPETAGGDPGLEPGGRLLDLCWDALVFLYGRDDLLDIRNVERFKREIKVCYQLLDSLLLQASSPLFSDLTGCVDVVMVSDSAVLQTFLEAFTEASESPYGCLVVSGRVAVATERWWGLSPSELVLLSALVLSMASCSARDVPVYLPHGSPSVPHRLLTFELMHGVTVCIICGPSPSLASLEKEIGRFWVPAVETLKSARQTIPRNIPTSMELDGNILGLLVVNRSTNRCLNSVSLAGGASGRANQGEQLAKQEKRRAVLRSFYTMVMGTYFTKGEEGSAAGEDTGPRELSHQPTDTYIVCSGHKCYAHTTAKYKIFVLFVAKMPTFAMGSITKKMLNLITKDKNCPL